ncbi:MAG TPA: ATP-binding protein [Streptosporangiaceae bacterium]|nr:ATP-binding protein [Streptosporangiaceae bacterium]
MTFPLHFIGRDRDMARLQRQLDTVTEDGHGRLLSIRGRRQAGKSRLVTEFADRTGLPQLFFTGARLARERAELARFAVEAAGSSLPGAGLFDGVAPGDWTGALRLLAAALPDAGPAIVVLDEFPWLRGSSPDLEGALQVAWDRVLERRPVLFILIGSDISVMEALSTYERPLFGRVNELVVNPFELGDTARMTAVHDPVIAIDAQLLTGGYPRLCAEWRGAPDAMAFLRRQLADENSELIDVGRNILTAEFPPDLQATRVLSAIGSGERTFKGISARSGIGEQQLARSLEALTTVKRAVSADRPVSLKSGNDPRYRVADSYLRFWLRFIEPSLPDIARGRPDLALARIRDSWPDFQGRAVEPIIRASVERLVLDDPDLGGTGVIGGYWTRSTTVEVDLVGVDRWPNARKVTLAGSVKWREQSPFGRRDLADLIEQRAHVPGAADAALVGVSRSGFAVDGLDRAYAPSDLVAAWRNIS